MVTAKSSETLAIEPADTICAAASARVGITLALLLSVGDGALRLRCLWVRLRRAQDYSGDIRL